MNQDINTGNDEVGVQIEGLARDLARTISTAPAGQRERLRDMAVHVLRDEVEIIEPAVPTATSRNASNPFAMGIPLILVGFVMLVMFPPVGLLLCAAAGLMMVWGVAAVFLVRRDS